MLVNKFFIPLEKESRTLSDLFCHEGKSKMMIISGRTLSLRHLPTQADTQRSSESTQNKWKFITPPQNRILILKEKN